MTKKGKRPGKDESEPIITRSMRVSKIYTLPNYAGYFDAEPASPDVPFIWGSFGGFLEIKTGHDNAMPFYVKKGEGGWGTHQIEWALEHWRDFDNRVFLGVMYNLKNDRQRLFIVPFPIAYDAIQKIAVYQNTLPCELNNHHSLHIRNANLSASTLWHQWEVHPYIYSSGKRKEHLWQVAPIFRNGFLTYPKFMAQ